jgi:hypothetical protein
MPPCFAGFSETLTMKEIKLTGRERCVLRAVNFSVGATGQEIADNTKLPAEDLADILNGLMGVGYVESDPYADATTTETVLTTIFEVNPSYALQLKEAMMKGM